VEIWVSFANDFFHQEVLFRTFYRDIIGLFCRDIGLFCGDIGLFCKWFFPSRGAIFYRDIIELCCGDMGLFCGDMGLICWDMGLFCKRFYFAARATKPIQPQDVIYTALLRIYRRLSQKYRALFWRYSGLDTGLFCRDTGLFGGDTGLFCRWFRFAAGATKSIQPSSRAIHGSFIEINSSLAEIQGCFADDFVLQLELPSLFILFKRS